MRSRPQCSAAGSFRCRTRRRAIIARGAGTSDHADLATPPRRATRLRVDNLCRGAVRAADHRVDRHVRAANS